LWELLAGNEDGFEIERLAAEYFGPEASGDHRAAMLAELLADSVFFKQKGEAFVPRPEDQVREIKRQKDLEERRTREREEALAWCQIAAKGGALPAAPPGCDRFVGQLRAY